MYLLCIISYLRVRGLTLRTGLNAVLMIVMIASLAQSGWRSIYGVIVFLVALTFHLIHRRRTR